VIDIPANAPQAPEGNDVSLATMRDVAPTPGISVPTVSRVLNRWREVDPKLARRV
jgi:hypothetical protein